MPETRPLLSLALSSRNDDYGGNSRWRLQTALNYLAAGLEKVGRLSDAEVVVTDWGSEVPLHRVLGLTPQAQRIVRWVIVPPSLAHELENDSEFPVVLAQNTALRRSRGTYLAQIDADILIPLPFLDKLFRLLTEEVSFGVSIDQSLVVAQRRNLPFSLVSGSPAISQLQWVIERLGHLLPGESLDGVPYFGTGFILMHRRLWEDFRGFDERLLYRGGMETDLGRRVAERYPCVLLNHHGMRVYHLAHYTVTNALTHPRKHNRIQADSDFHQVPSSADWGLYRHALEEYRYSASQSPSRQGDLAQHEEGLFLTPRLVLAVGAILVRTASRQVTPAPVASLPNVLFNIAGNLRLLLQGKPSKDWPVTLWNFWRERRKRRGQVSRAG